MEHRGSAPDSARLRQVRDDLHGVRPRASRHGADPKPLQDDWPREIRRRRLVEEVDRELGSAEDDTGR